MGNRAARDRGFRLIAPDRPGIGGSDFQHGRQLLDWPGNVAEMADQLGLDRFGVMGVSGGGPYALACAYKIPHRLNFTVLMGSWAPVAAEPELWAAMAPLDRFFGRISRYAPWVFRLPFSVIGLAAKRLGPQGYIRALESLLSEDDKSLQADHGLAKFFVKDIREAFRQGAKGPSLDAILLYRDWGFSVSDIEVDVFLYHGTEDNFAPFQYGQYLDMHLPQSWLNAFPGRGHLFVLQLFEDVFKNAAKT